MTTSTTDEIAEPVHQSLQKAMELNHRVAVILCFVQGSKGSLVFGW